MAHAMRPTPRGVVWAGPYAAYRHIVLQDPDPCVPRPNPLCAPRSRLAQLNEKLTSLERKIDYLEARVSGEELNMNRAISET